MTKQTSTPTTWSQLLSAALNSPYFEPVTFTTLDAAKALAAEKALLRAKGNRVISLEHLDDAAHSVYDRARSAI